MDFRGSVVSSRKSPPLQPEIRGRAPGATLLALCSISVCGAAVAAPPPPLPVPCAAAACGAINTWVTSGSASLAQSGGRMDITQTSPTATLNWQSFDIAAGNTVNFIQPSTNSVALNRIFEANPSQIFGTLTSNGQVYLLNPNGLIFGPHSVVNVGSLIASSLAISPAAIKDGIAGAIQDGSAAFQAVDADGNPIQNLGVIDIQSGASITANGGEVLIFAPTVTNEGTIQAPSGQAILGAGQTVFLSVPQGTSSPVRGLLIEVGGNGTVTNGTQGEIVSTAGDVTLAGLAVNQMGRVSATTTIESNGSIQLEAQATTATSLSPEPSNTVQSLQGYQSGTLILGAGSSTDIGLQGSTADTTVDATAQPASTVELDGGEIEMLDGASIVAPHGNVSLNALSGSLVDPAQALSNLIRASLQPDSSRIWLAPTSTIDVSGDVVSQSASLESLAVELNSVELADSPQQRNGALHGQTVYIDIRQHGVTSDGTPWIGTPIADLSGDVAAIQHDVFQRSLTGGTISLNSSGSVLVSPGATLNVSGGQIDWQAGYVKSSILVGANGQLYPISAANPDLPYAGTLDSINQSDPHWGNTAYFTLPGYDPRGVYQSAYVQGEDAGSVSIVAPAFVLDGNIEGSAVRGPLQVNPPGGTTPEGELYRYADEVPLGGQLTVGSPQTAAGATDSDSTLATSEVLQGLSFAAGAVLQSLTGPSGGAFDPSIDPLPSGFVSSLSPDLLGGSGVARLQAYAQGNITVPAGTTLDPGPGGSVTLVAGEVNVSGAITTSAGSVKLESLPTLLFGAGLGVAPATSPATQLYLAPGARIDVSGGWVNQDPSLGPSALAPLFISGGSVQLLAPDGGSFVLAQGSSINASGGAQRTASGGLVAGSGGSITMTAAPASNPGSNPQGALELDASLSAFALEDGGSLAVTLPALCVSSAVCSDKNAYRIDPGYLTDFGFGDVSLASDSGGLTIAEDVDSTVRQLNLEFMRGAFDLPSAGSLAGLTTVVTLPQYLRQHEDLSLSSATLAPSQTPASVTYADLTVAQGASLDFDPQASVSLTTNSRIFMNGSLIDPAGTISLGITGDVLASSVATVLGDQAIWLGPASTLDTSGTVVLTPNNLGLQLGNVLPGGTVSVDAERGYLLALPGSSILAAGTTAVIDESSPLSASSYQLATVASAGGSIELSAAEGMQLDGTFAAPAGAGASAAGGTLSLTLDGDNARAGAVAFDAGNPQVDASRILTVTTSTAPTVVAEGASVPGSLDGQGSISAATINSGGFDNVTLTARNLVGLIQVGDAHPDAVISEGVVAFDPGVSLSPRASLVIDAPELSASSGQVSLSSAYVALGSDDTQTQALDVGRQAAAGPATLSVNAQLIDLVGAMELNGFSNTTLSSSGDIRAVGVQLDLTAVGYGGDSTFSGSLVSPGALALAAQQIYPTTLTSYDIDLTGDTAAKSTLSLTTAPGSAAAVLSAAGSLTLQANQILDSGVLRAPMGTISLVGETLTPDSGPGLPSTVELSSGAVVSVSTGGLTIPFGETQGGLDWTYTLRAGDSGGDTVVYGTGSGDIAPPQKQVAVTADSFQLSPGATIDVSGGGDLAAYEFTPGLGGTNDVLSTSFAPNTYAVIPGLTLPYAPIDPHEDIGFAQSVGSSVYLSGGNGLPAGTYALLPARYALLPGAYLVTPVSGYTNLAAGQSVAQADGSRVISGYRTVAGSGTRDSQTSGWDVTPGSYAYQEAQYTLTSANTFFAAQAVANDTATPRLPEDAGSLSLEVTSAAQLAGNLLSSPAEGGRGGTLDLTATNLYIGANPADAPAGGSYVTIDPAQLDALGAQSILLGATRSVSGDSTALTVGAQNLVVGQNASLTAPEIILAASGALELESGAQVQASGSTLAAEPDFSAPAGTALLRASTGPQVGFTSTGDSPSSGAASLTVAQGAVVGATGSMSFDASGTVDFSGVLSATNAAVRVGSDDIALGAVPAGFDGFAIGAALLGNLSSSQLTLDATAPVAVYGPVSLTLSSLDIAAPGIDVSQDGALDVTAGSITLGNPGNSATAVAGTGSVSLAAAHVVLADGAFTLSGANAAAITASGDLTGTGSGSLNTAGSLSLTSPVMQSAAGADYAFTATGALTTGLPASGAGAVTAAAGPGGSLSFTGSSVELGGNIVLPGGRVQVTADAGDVTVGDGATIDVAGFSETFDGETQSAGGGMVGLSSAAGNVNVAAGAVIDVSAGSGAGSGGELDVSAPGGNPAGGNVILDGQIRGGGSSGQSGGNLSVEAQSLDFGALVALAATGGFSGAVEVHERGPGDLVIAGGTTLEANDVELTADQGNIDVMGAIDASNDLGGTIMLAAGSNIDIYGALSAGSPARADRGGTVELYTDSPSGGIYVHPGSSIEAGGTGANGNITSTGTLWLRAPAQNVIGVLGGGPQLIDLAGTITGAAHTYLEGYSQVSLPDGAQIDATTQAWAQNAASSFMAEAMPGTGETVAQALGQAANPAFSVLPGIEIDSPGSLTVAGVWDFSAWRYGPNSDPGVLTIRTGGSLIVASGAAISDGFDGTTGASGFQLDPAMQTSWSYRLAAGANLASASPLAVVTQTELAPEQAANPIQSPGDAPYGSLYLESGGLSTPGNGATDPTMIRTGTGTIDIAAAGDLELGNQASVIYTAGAGYMGAVATGKRGILDKNLGLPDLTYPVGGGDVSIDVGQDLIGATSNQLFNDWLWRSGETSVGTQTPAPVSWLPAYAYFEQGIGALGGGDLTLRAGGNIVDLGASVPSSAIPEVNASGGVTTTEVNAGILRVTAGGDIEGGKFLDLAGQAYVTAGGQVTIGSDQAGPGTGLYPVLALGGGQFTVTARQGLSIDAIVDPTLLATSTEEQANSSENEYAGFSTYGDASRVTLTSTGGDVTYLNRTIPAEPLQQTSSNLSFSGAGLELETLPPTLQAIALGGNVTLDGSMVLWPSAHGNLDLLAGKSVLFTGVTLDLSDADPTLLPGVTNPSPLVGDPQGFTQLLGALAAGLGSSSPTATATGTGADPYAPEPVHGGAYSADGTPDTVPARVVALAGDVSFQAPQSQPTFTTIFNVAKPIDIVAGGDIVDLSLFVQQFSPANITNVIAGGSITYPNSRDPTGSLVQDPAGITVAGPGRLDVQAGGTINLGTSEGVSTIGNLLNPALLAQGADVTVSAGISKAPDYAAFINTYMAQSDLYDDPLIQYVEQLTGATGLDKAQALTALQSLPAEYQAPLLQQLLFDELRAGGRAAAAAGAGHGNFTSAFGALEALFPGSTAAEARNDPYSGDILLYFSKVYTVSGGDINLLAPGGLINVGLAVAPVAFGIQKPPSDLGIVAQQQGSINMVSYSDIDVNLSRVFAADGGDILMWSTQGNIDAGRGARSAISAPPPTVTIDPRTGAVTEVFPNALIGSGIQALSTTPGTTAGSVDLFAPHGVVNANEAGIVAGNITIYAVQVLGTNNISFSGTAVGVPVAVTGLGAGLAAASSSGAAAGSVGGTSITQSSASQNQAPQAQAALNWLDVFVLGLGEAQCAPADLECIKKQQMQH
jgi:filamentous hemagglutinin family protein